jgi:hypothetical protein
MNVVRIVRLLNEIYELFEDIQRELNYLKSIGNAKQRLAVSEAILATGTAIAAVSAAIGSPEPITKIALVLPACGAVAVAICKIENAIAAFDEDIAESLIKLHKKIKRILKELEDIVS